jgi:thioesterase domain-containing protein
VLGAKAAITLDQIFGNGGAKVDHTSRSMPYILERLAIEHEKAYQAYSPRPFIGNVMLFRVQHQLPGVANDRSLGWKSLLGDSLDIGDMPGHQQNLLSPPHVQSLAKELMSRLKQAQGVWAGKLSAVKVGALR